jgi:hypothetical protein
MFVAPGGSRSDPAGSGPPTTDRSPLPGGPSIPDPAAPPSCPDRNRGSSPPRAFTAESDPVDPAGGSYFSKRWCPIEDVTTLRVVA